MDEIDDSIKLKQFELELALRFKELELKTNAETSIEIAKINAKINAETSIEIAKINAEKEARIEIEIKKLEVSNRESFGSTPFVYVIAIYTNGIFELSGNPFAITPTKIVTAFHNLYDESNLTNTNESRLTYRDAIIYQKVTKDSKDQPLYHDPVHVKLCDFNYVNDWAVLEVVKGKIRFFNQSVQEQPSDLKYLEICPNDINYLPKEGFDDLKAHYYDISLFNSSNDTEEKLICQRYDYRRVCLFKEISHMYRVQDGLSKGSSGCPYINKSNMVVAMHVASLDSSFQRESRARFHPTNNEELKQLNEENMKGRKRGRDSSLSIWKSSLTKEVTANSENISDISSVADNFSHYKEGFALCKDEQFRLHLKKHSLE